VAPNREGKGLQPGASPGAACVPKKEVAINPINPLSELDARPAPVRKSSIPRSILIRSGPRLAGSYAFDVLQGLVFFSYLISKIFVYTLFEPASKIMLR